MTKRRAIALGVVLLIAVLGWTGYRVLRAKSHVTQAKGHLAAARQALVDRDLERAKGEIAIAGKETAQARSQTDDPVVAALSHIPLLGRELHVIRGISTAADDISRKILPGGLALSRTLDPKTLRAPDGTVDVAAIAKVQPQAKTLSTAMATIRTRVHDLPGGIGPIKTARTDFVNEVDRLDDALQGANEAVDVAPAFLGADQPRRWFVLIQQFAESRGTGGIPGGYAVLRASGGKLTVEQHGSNQDLKDVHVAGTSVDAQFRGRYELTGAFDIWPNINLSPDLPSVAKLINEKWRAQGGRQLDGVIALDARSLALLLKGGPGITLANGKTLPADQIEPYLNLGQYVGVNGEPGNQNQRKDALSAVAKQVLDRITRGGGDNTTLVKGIIAALGSRHLHMATAVNPLHDVLHREDLDGALPSGETPVAYAVINNAAASKLDTYIDRRVEYSGGSCDGKRRKTKIVVELTSHAPAASTLPPYVTLNSAGERTIHTSTNNVLLEVYGTKGAVVTSATLDGQAVSSVQDRTEIRLEIAKEGGLPVWQVPIALSPGVTQRLVLDLSEPTAKGAPRILEQPLATSLAGSLSLPTC